MTIELDENPFDLDEDPIDDGDLLGYYRPRDIVEDPALTVGRKREFLAHWASDIHSVAGAPALRSVRGRTVPIDEILEALKQLDNMTDATFAVANGRQHDTTN